jgi:hypothetical protein
MNPATIALVIGLVEEAIKEAPAVAAEIKTIFANGNPTPDDWAALKAKVLSQSFESLAPNAKLE